MQFSFGAARLLVPRPVEGQRVFQAFLPGDVRDVVQAGARGGDVGGGVLDVAGARGLVAGREVLAGELVQLGGKLEEGARALRRRHPGIPLIVECDTPSQVERALAFIRARQEADGSFFGRWGVNYLYGTWSVLCALGAIGEDVAKPYVRKAVQWLQDHQNADGGWGESCESYDQSTFVAAPSTPSQTAWGILGLLASGDSTSDSVQKGVEYLMETQRADGGWDEALSTGTGFPRVFYLKYHLYRHSFPVLALAQYRKALEKQGTSL